MLEKKSKHMKRTFEHEFWSIRWIRLKFYKHVLKTVFSLRLIGQCQLRSKPCSNKTFNILILILFFLDFFPSYVRFLFPFNLDQCSTYLNNHKFFSNFFNQNIIRTF
jgi:hypothetical protein